MKPPTKTIALTLSVAALALAGGSAALADNHGKTRADANGDGQISLAEMQSRHAAMFARMDANSDGVIDADDRAVRQAARFAAMDADKDGEVTPAEMQAAGEARRAQRRERMAERRETTTERRDARFARLDTDNSGGLSQAEMAGAREARGDRAERRGQRSERMGPMGRGGRGGHAMTGMMLRTADTDKDGAITRAEFDNALATHFARVDADGNGAITAEERQAAHTQMRAQMRERMQQRRAGQGQQ